MRQNTDQKNSEYAHFSRSERSIFFSFLFLFELTISLLFKDAFYAKTRGMFRILSIITDGAFSRYYFCKRARSYKLGRVINMLLELYINELIFKHVSSFIISYFFYFFSQVGQKQSLLYVFNGVLFMIAFFIGRVFMLPYLYYQFSIYKNISFLEVPVSIPFYCNIGSALFLSLQLYWFYLVVLSVFRYAYKSGKLSNTKQSNINGTFNGNGLRSVNNGSLHSEKSL